VSDAAPAPIQGTCPPQFQAVRDQFEKHFADGEELGAGFALAIDGEIVIDLTGGWTDRRRSEVFGPDTLASIFSTTKTATSLMMARLVSQGRLDYRQTVASIWPEFGGAGKDAITVEQALSHQAGLPGFLEPMEPTAWFDHDLICARLAALEPMWPPGTASGYHPLTFGYIADEVHRRIDGRSIGTALREDVAGPLGLDLWIGLPPTEHHRSADIQRPTELPAFGAATPALKAAFLTRWASIGGKRLDNWLTHEFPSAGGQATAPALARLMAALACDGMIGGTRVLEPGIAALAGAERIAGQDLVLPFEVSWGAGYLRNPPNMFYGPETLTIAHSGWGGSCAFADPVNRISGAYVMNRQSTALVGDIRPRRLIEAVYAGL
jgi:CubicO group peptidase (beta-lactamase class C family)